MKDRSRHESRDVGYSIVKISCINSSEYSIAVGVGYNYMHTLFNFKVLCVCMPKGIFEPS